MLRVLLTFLFATVLVMMSFAAAFAQNKPAQCEQAPRTDRNWEVIGIEYVYFDYILCPANTQPPSPLVKVWITTNGNGFAVEKWAQDRDGADTVSVFYGSKRAFTLYRDLNAIPLRIFKAERRTAVPAEIGKQPFMGEGTTLVPLENLTPDSAERVRKVFEVTDGLIRAAQKKVPLLRETTRIAVIVEALELPLKAQK